MAIHNILSDDDFRYVLDTTAKEEGFVAEPYTCPTGHLTVGYGTKFPISIVEGEWLLEYRLRKYIQELDKGLADNGVDLARLPSNAQRALCLASYQLGVPKLRRFKKMFAAIRADDYKTAADEMLNSLWAKQTPARVKRIAALMRGEE